MKFYAGVGSRKTPPEIRVLMKRTAEFLAREGWTLRSGHATGADRAFEQGAASKAVIYLPWPGFGCSRYGNDPGMLVLGKAVVLPKADLLARYRVLVKSGIHGGNPKETVQLLHGRNHAQVFGHQDSEPASAFVVCWCEEVHSVPQGGTATAVKLAQLHGLPVFNLWKQADREKIERKIR